MEKEIEKVEERAADKEGDRVERKEQFTGVVFVVLKNESDKNKLIEYRHYNWKLSLKRKWCKYLCDFKFWEFKRAPEPSDIIWQNLGIRHSRRILQTLFVWTITILILVGSGYVINLIKKAEDDLKDKEKSKQKTNMF